MEGLIGHPIVMTEKMDGSNTSLESSGCFARTHADAPTHASFDMLKVLHATIKHKIPDNVQLFGEWCYALHSIPYSELPGYFLLFNVAEYPNANHDGRIHVEGRAWHSWDMVELWAEDIGVPTVPVLFKGEVYSEMKLQELVESFMKQPSVCGGIREGVVVRRAEAFKELAFPTSVMKCVRANHVQTSEHWKDQEIVRNKLKLSNTGP
jgi:hypothetical protein